MALLKLNINIDCSIWFNQDKLICKVKAGVPVSINLKAGTYMFLIKVDKSPNDDFYFPYTITSETDCYEEYIEMPSELDLLTYRANDGDLEAQFELGCYFYNNNDIDSALLWFKKAADYGHIASAYNVFIIYKDKQEDQIAFKYLEIAVSGEFPQAEYYMGQCYKLGICVQQDIFEAMKYFSRAASHGLQEGCIEYNNCLLLSIDWNNIESEK